MLLTIFNKAHLVRLSILAFAGITLSGCSSLNQKPYDVDGIYNNSKIVVEDTHEKGAYYTEYFKEKAEESEAYFTDVENYSSNYNDANGGWGDTTSDTQIVYNYPYSSWGWGYPYAGWYDSYWGFGFGFGWGGYWGYPYYGWGYPYYGYGWGYPYYGYRNVSRSYSYRNLTSRQLNGGRMAVNNNRNLRTNSLRRANGLSTTNRTFARANTTLNRMNVSERTLQNSRNTRFNSDRINRNSRINTNNTSTRTNTRMERTTRPTYTPSSSTRMNSGGSFGGSRGGSMGGGMRSGGGRR